MSETLLKEMLNKLNKMGNQISSMECEFKEVKSKINVITSNQLTFLHELREQRLETQTTNRILFNDLREINERVRLINRRVADIELDMAIKTPASLEASPNLPQD